MISRRQIIDSNQQADSGEFGPYKLSSQQQLNKQARTREDAKLAKPQSDHRTSLSSSNNSRTKMPAARGQNKTNRQKNFLLGRQDFEGQQERLEEEEEEPEEEFALAGDQMADYRHFDPYSVYGEEDEEEDVWYSEERLFEVSFILIYYGPRDRRLSGRPGDTCLVSIVHCCVPLIDRPRAEFTVAN